MSKPDGAGELIIGITATAVSEMSAEPLQIVGAPQRCSVRGYPCLRLNRVLPRLYMTGIQVRRSF